MMALFAPNLGEQIGSCRGWHAGAGTGMHCGQEWGVRHGALQNPTMRGLLDTLGSDGDVHDAEDLLLCPWHVLGSSLFFFRVLWEPKQPGIYSCV